jgi:hypothetical protein
MSMEQFHTEKYTLLIAADLRVREEWQVSMSPAQDPKFSFARKSQVVRRHRWEDAFRVRLDFLTIQSPEDALQFFKLYGPFQYKVDKTGSKNADPEPESVLWSVIERAVNDFEQSLIAQEVPKWLYRFTFGQPLMLELPFQPITPELTRYPDWKEDAAIAHCNDVVEALRASIFLSRIRGFQWKRCARKGCGQLFEQDTKHQKIYCSPECAHLQAVNDYNARKKKALKPRKTHPKKGR